jgi:hypothetical protein
VPFLPGDRPARGPLALMGGMSPAFTKPGTLEALVGPAIGLSIKAIRIAGALILSGLDRTIEAALVRAMPDWLIDLTTRF